MKHFNAWLEIRVLRLIYTPGNFKKQYTRFKNVFPVFKVKDF